MTIAPSSKAGILLAFAILASAVSSVAGIAALGHTGALVLGAVLASWFAFDLNRSRVALVAPFLALILAIPWSVSVSNDAVWIVKVLSLVALVGLFLKRRPCAPGKIDDSPGGLGDD